MIKGLLAGFVIAFFTIPLFLLAIVHPEPLQQTIQSTSPMFGTMLCGVFGVLAARCNFSIQNFHSSARLSFKQMSIEAKAIFVLSISILLLGALMLGTYTYKAF